MATLQHYFPQKYNLSNFNGKAIEAHAVFYSLPDNWIIKLFNIPPVTVMSINKIINKAILDNGYYILDITIWEEPANWLFFKDKYTTKYRFYPHTEKAKAEIAKIKPIEYTMPKETQNELSIVS